METKIIWQQGTNQSNQPEALATIGQWWASLNGKEVSFAQRVIPESGDIQQIDWDRQKLDENFVIANPQLRGITLFWYKQNLEQERSLTPDTLELNQENQELYIYPQSQPQVVIRVALPGVNYQQIELQNPLIVGKQVGENCVLLVRDKQQQLDVKIILSNELWAQLRSSLPS